MNRLTARLQELKGSGQKAFIAYFMAGVPSWERVREIILELERCGVSAVELGVPFSDPIADGPVIQAAAEQSLARGVSLEQIFDQVEIIRRKSELPLLLMGYWNVFLQFGRRRCLQRAREAGVDGFIIADLPPEADPEFFDLARQYELCTVLLASELTPESRLKRIAAAGSGFLYYVPQAGITGLKLSIGAQVEAQLDLIRRLTRIPVCVGIGVKTRREARLLDRHADGVIVGTRIVEFIQEHSQEPDLAPRLAELVRGLMP